MNFFKMNFNEEYLKVEEGIYGITIKPKYLKESLQQITKITNFENSIHKFPF
jgi:hypothetical protein